MITKDTNNNKSICLYFQVHQPMRIKRYRFFQIGADHYYYDDYLNRSIVQRVAEKCYLPANRLMLEKIREHNGAFKIAYSLSGTVIEQLEMYAPEVLDSFKELAQTGCVEFLAETYSHSLSSLKDTQEFKNQVEQHAKKIEQLFGQKPQTFRNTELVYSDSIGETVYNMGYKAVLMEGAKHILGWKSPNFVYKNPDEPQLKLLMRNFRLSDDIAFRFSNRDWVEWPLTTNKFCEWINTIEDTQPTVNIFMDYETFGEHQWEETGIFEFLSNLPGQILSNTDRVFRTPTEVAQVNQASTFIHAPHPVSWADEERDLTAWLGNDLQNDAFKNLYDISPLVSKCNDAAILKDWQYLQNSDHFYYMCTKWFSDGDVHSYFTPYDSPYDAYINYMNVLADFEIRVKEHCELVEEPIKVEVEKEQSQNKSNTSSAFSAEFLKKVSKTKLKSILRDFDAQGIYAILSELDQSLREKVKDSVGKRVLNKVTILENEKVKIAKKEISKYSKRLKEALK